MLKGIIAVIRTAWNRAGLAVISAEHAHTHYGLSLSRREKLYNLCEGFFEGLALGMRNVRGPAPAFDPEYRSDVHFTTQGGNLLVHVNLPTAGGVSTSVVSTLSYTEAAAVASGLEVLRGTGVFALADDQAAAFIRCVHEMQSARHPNPSQAWL